MYTFCSLFFGCSAFFFILVHVRLRPVYECVVWLLLFFFWSHIIAGCLFLLFASVSVSLVRCFVLTIRWNDRGMPKMSELEIGSSRTIQHTHLLGCFGCVACRSIPQYPHWDGLHGFLGLPMRVRSLTHSRSPRYAKRQTTHQAQIGKMGKTILAESKSRTTANQQPQRRCETREERKSNEI